MGSDAAERGTVQEGATPSWATASGRDDHGPWSAFTVGAVTQRLRYIPPGVFWMGSPPEEPGRSPDEGPRHQVELTRGCWLGETPVTQALWEAVIPRNPSRFPGADRPVESVSWHDATAFLAALSTRLPGLGARLPTEAEWERACRSGTDGPNWQGAHTRALLDPIAWHLSNSGRETHAVGTRLPNPLGLFDMLGNVLEWCADSPRAYAPGPARDPVGEEGVRHRAYRGGSWGFGPKRVRAASRGSFEVDTRIAALGFRLVAG